MPAGRAGSLHWVVDDRMEAIPCQRLQKYCPAQRRCVHRGLSGARPDRVEARAQHPSEGRPGSRRNDSRPDPGVQTAWPAVLYFCRLERALFALPFHTRLVAAFKEELSRVPSSRKARSAFRFSEPVPARLIERLAKFRAKEADRGPRERKVAARTTPRRKR